MIKNILRSIAAILALFVLMLSVLYLNRSEPYGILPGKQLQGEEVAGPIDDWSFTLQHRRVINEVRPDNPYSVNTSSLLVDGRLYLPSGSGGESRWARYLIEDPNMRLKVGGNLYKVRATRVEDPDQLNTVREAYRKKYPGRLSDNVARFWFFQVESR